MYETHTRRAKEYFEVFDELRDEGYIAHEEWVTTPVEKRELVSKMTNQIIADALFEKGYSRGSPNELLKYRRRWLNNRGFLEEQGIQQEISRDNDPIVGAVEAFKKRIEKEAHEKAEQAIQSMQLQLNNIKEEYANLKQEHQTVLNERNLATSDLKELKNINKSLENEGIKLKKDFSSLESSFNTAEKKHAEYKEEKEQHHVRMMQAKDDSINHLTKDIDQFRSDYKQNLSDSKEQSEKQRHDFIAKIDGLTVENQKLSKTLHKSEMVEQKANDQHQILQKQLNQFKTTYNDLNKDFKHKADLLLKSEKQISALDSKVNELKSIIVDEKAQKQVFHEKLLNTQKDIGRLTTENNELKRQIERVKTSASKNRGK